MRDVLLVARQELVYNLRRPAFILMTLLVPALGVVALVVGSLFGGQVRGVVQSQFGPVQKPIGYVDHSGLLSADLPEYAQRFVAYPDEESARAALRAEEISSYLVVPADYLATGTVVLYGMSGAFSTFMAADSQNLDAFLVDHLLRGKVDDRLRQRAVKPSQIQPVTLDATGQVSRGGRFSWLGDFVVPYVAAILFVMTLFSTSGFLLQGVAEEKEGRIMEILLSSITPSRLLAGKILGLGALGLIQVAVWLGSGVGLLAAGTAVFAMAGVISVKMSTVMLGLVYFALGFLLYATMMAVAGSLGSTQRESQQIAGIFSFAAAIPWVAFGGLVNNPGSTLAVVLSYIPLTAPMMMLLRLGFGQVPPGQVAISIVLLVVGIAVSLWAGAKVFRVGLLMYGKRPSLAEILAAFRQA